MQIRLQPRRSSRQDIAGPGMIRGIPHCLLRSAFKARPATEEGRYLRVRYFHENLDEGYRRRTWILESMGRVRLEKVHLAWRHGFSLFLALRTEENLYRPLIGINM